MFRHGMFLLICIASVLSFTGVFLTDILCSLLGAGETFHQLSAEYLFWYSVFIIPSSLSYALQHYCRNDGAPGLVGMTVIITVCNIFGDWLLIFPFHMGMKCAAIATGVSQSLGLFIMLIHFVRRQGILRFGKAKLERSLVKDIIVHGLPEGISEFATPVMILCMNLVLVDKVGDIGVNAFSIIWLFRNGVQCHDFSISVFNGALFAIHDHQYFKEFRHKFGSYSATAGDIWHKRDLVYVFDLRSNRADRCGGAAKAFRAKRYSF